MKLPTDKLLHFMTCYFLVTFGTALIELLYIAVIFTAVVAVGKEIYDWCKYGKNLGWKAFAPMAFGDIIADGIGIAIGVLLYMI
jgi:uncharacterized protein YfiM (DUF2279 family)